ncbi:MAG: hypothetical protein ACUVTP_11300 [Candidatus Fervidibacter sp.]
MVTELGDLPSEARKQNVKPPAVLIVGEVVRLREKLMWYELKPLFGKRMLFPCTDETKDLASKLEDLGAEVACRENRNSQKWGIAPKSREESP